MKPQLEQIQIKDVNRSFLNFNSEVDAFTPFWHYHPELELTLILKGEGTRFIGDSIEPFSNFDLVLIGKNVPHHWVSLNNSNEEKQEAVVIQFSDTLFNGFNECAHFHDLFDLAERGIHFDNPNTSQIERISNLRLLNPIEQLAELFLLFDELSQYLNKRLLTSENYKSLHERQVLDNKFSKVNNYVLEHLNHKLSVNKMAEMTHMVPQSFCRWFKKHSGHSFVSFLNLTRVERACQYLITTSESIQSIAFNCGFETLSHFNRTFKTIKGCNPREFRKNNINN